METFIVRLQPAGEGPEPSLHGLVESVGARESRPFRSEHELLSHLRELLDAAGAFDRQRRPRKGLSRE